MRIPLAPPLGACGLALLALMVMGGCTFFKPSLEAPRISLVDIRQQPSQGMETAFDLKLRLINPNEVPLKLKGIDCRLEINDSTIASGVSGQAATLPALDTLVYPVTIYASPSDFILMMVRLLTESGRSPEDFELNYTLEGRVFLADGLPGLNRLTFTSAGDLLELIEPPQEDEY